MSSKASASAWASATSSLRLGGAAEARADPREQDREAEGFDDVVVRAEVQAAHLVDLPAERETGELLKDALRRLASGVR